MHSDDTIGDIMEREKGIIERGTVLEAQDGGYTVASLDRDGITTPPLKALEEGAVFNSGERVYYFIFSDGTGRIICGF